MSALHQLTAIGRIARVTPKSHNGRNVLDITVAVNDSYQVGESEKEITTWYQVTFWGDDADRVAKREYQTGDTVVITGQPELSPFIGKNGEPNASIRLRFPRVHKITGRKAEGNFTAAPTEELEPVSKVQKEPPF